MLMRSVLPIAGALLAAALASSCGGTNVRVTASGSSSVYPLTEAVAEEYALAHPGAHLTVGVAGTGGGFKQFCAGEIDLCNASRPIRPAEARACAEKGVAFLELPIALDAIAVVANPQNDWADAISVEELGRIWAPAAQGHLLRWSQVRAGWPARPIHLYGPGVDSGTYDLFTEAVVGHEHASRGDYLASEDANVLVEGVARDPLGLGFFSLAYALANADRLKVLAVQAGDSAPAVKPDAETVRANAYRPLSRPLFLYVNAASARRPTVSSFVSFFLREAPGLAPELGFIGLPEPLAQRARERLARGRTGSAFAAARRPAGVGSLEALLARDAEEDDEEEAP